MTDHNREDREALIEEAERGNRERQAREQRALFAAAEHARLIEKAADAIARARGYVQGACLEEHYRDARAAFAVFEAHVKELATSPERVKIGADSLHVTPTDDEREKLISAAHNEADQRYGATDWTDGPGSSAFRWVDRGKAGAFVDGAIWHARRTVQGDPALIECPHWSPGKITMRKDCTACAAVQGEPTDPNQISNAVADAAQIAMHEFAWGDEPIGRLSVSRQGWKVAIAAALDATQEGENR